MSEMQKKRAKADEWLSKECWLAVVGEYIVNCPHHAERLMIMLMYVRHLMLGNHSEREKAFQAISHFINACQPFTRSEVVWELINKERQQPDSED